MPELREAPKIAKSRKRLRGRDHRRNVLAHSAFYDPRRSSSRGWSWTAAQSRRSMQESLPTTDGSANADLVYDLPVLRERSRALIRNNPLAAGAIRTTVANVVGRGLVPQSRIDGEYLGLSRDQAQAWQMQAERLYWWWSNSRACDAQGRLTMPQMQKLAMRSPLENGDAFVLRRQVATTPTRPVGLALQLLEADRVGNPVGMFEGRATDAGGYVTQGVEVGPQGQVERYYIADRHPGDLNLGSLVPEYKPVPARGLVSGEWLVLHIGDMDRIDQARGLPLLAPVLEPLHQLSEYHRIELTRAAVASLFTAFIKTPGGVGLAPEETDDEDSSHPEDYRMGPGALLDLDLGEDVVLADPKSQGPAFDAFVLAILRQVGPSIGIPLELLTLHFQSSYSAARAALLEGWKTFALWRALLVEQFCQPTWGAFISDCVGAGLLDAPGFFDDVLIREAYTQAQWTGPTPGQLDPLKEVQAARERINLGMSSIAEETAQLTGGDWEAVHEQRVIERQRRVADGLEMVAPPASPSQTVPEDPDAADDAETAERDEMAKRSGPGWSRR